MRLLPLLLLVACATPSDDPYWALDPMWIEGDGDGIVGVQTWELFTEAWGRNFARRHYLCSVVVALEGRPVAGDDCPGCTAAWQIEPRRVDSDCPDAVATDPGFLSLSGLALAEDWPAVETDVPHPEHATGILVDHGDGWIEYGWAYPAALEHGEPVQTSTWDGTQPFALWPAFAWQLD